MQHTPIKIIITTLGILFFLFILCFGYNRFGRYISGPQIIDISIHDYQTIPSSRVEVTGSVKNVQRMLINERELILHDDNTFRELVVISPGTNTLTITLIDPFEKKKTYYYHLYNTQEKDNYPESYSEAVHQRDGTLHDDEENEQNEEISGEITEPIEE